MGSWYYTLGTLEMQSQEVSENIVSPTLLQLIECNTKCGASPVKPKLTDAKYIGLNPMQVNSEFSKDFSMYSALLSARNKCMNDCGSGKLTDQETQLIQNMGNVAPSSDKNNYEKPLPAETAITTTQTSGTGLSTNMKIGLAVGALAVIGLVMFFRRK